MPAVAAAAFIVSGGMGTVAVTRYGGKQGMSMMRRWAGGGLSAADGDPEAIARSERRTGTVG